METVDNYVSIFIFYIIIIIYNSQLEDIHRIWAVCPAWELNKEILDKDGKKCRYMHDSATLSYPSRHNSST